jgi:hypothetical protein
MQIKIQQDIDIFKVKIIILQKKKLKVYTIKIKRN